MSRFWCGLFRGIILTGGSRRGFCKVCSCKTFALDRYAVGDGNCVLLAAIGVAALKNARNFTGRSGRGRGAEVSNSDDAGFLPFDGDVAISVHFRCCSPMSRARSAQEQTGG